MTADSNRADGNPDHVTVMPIPSTAEVARSARSKLVRDETRSYNLTHSTLEHSESGRFLVAPESGSRYLLDFGRNAFVRLPKADEAGLWAMRGDGGPVQLLRLVKCVVGRRMQLLLDLGIPGIATTNRETTMVLTIAEVPADAEGSELEISIRALGRGRAPHGDAADQLTHEEDPHGNH